MKTMALMLSLLAAGLGASFALASPGHGHSHGKSDSTTATSTTSTTQACRPTVSYVLNGTFVAAGADGSSFSMSVAHANHHARALGAAPAVSVDARTRIVRNGKKAVLADLQAGDRLNVQARGCKSPAAGPAPALVARRVFAHPAKAASGGTTTTTETTTTDEETTTTTAP